MALRIDQPTGHFDLVNGRIILPQAVITGKAVVIEDRKIVGIADRASLGENLATVDVGGRYISPGLIDIHTHGAVSHSFNEPTAVAWQAITCENVKRGVTSLLATVATAAIPDLVDCLNFGREWLNNEQDGT